MAGSSWDLIVVGAGPAGAAAALEARRLAPGARVLLLDRADFPRDKACGDGIGPHAVAELAELGAASVLDGYPPIQRLRLRAPGGIDLAGTCERPSWVVPRKVLDTRLVELAVAAGAELRRVRVRQLERRDGRVVVNGELAAPAVVGADGANSTVRRLLGVPASPARRSAIALRGYAPAPPKPAEQLIGWVAEGWPAYVWSFPTGTGLVNVGYGLLRSRLRGGVLLCGDAASMVNPLSGEGIYYALASGRLAARAGLLAPERPAAAYQAMLHELLGRHFRHAALLGLAIRWQPLARAALAGAAGSPARFQQLVDLGLGQARITPSLLAGVTSGLRAGRR